MTEKQKRIIVAIAIAAAFAIVAYRAASIIREHYREVFNFARFESAVGTPVETMVAKVQKENLYQPVAVRSGRIFVSAARIHKFKAGQKLTARAGGADARDLGGQSGAITSVSHRIDLDTGLFVIRTTAPSGNHFVEVPYNGIFVPLSAIYDSSAMVVKDGIAVAKPVEVIARDAARAVVSGLSDGDVVILTKIDEGTKVRWIADL